MTEQATPLQVDIPGLGALCRHAVAFIHGHVWCYGGFDGAKTLGDTLCIDIAQLGQLQASSHSTEPKTFSSSEAQQRATEKARPAKGKRLTPARGASPYRPAQEHMVCTLPTLILRLATSFIGGTSFGIKIPIQNSNCKI